jgi:hypothetical protein
MLVATLVVVLVVAREHLPVALDQTPPPSAQHPMITGHPLLLAAQAVSALCFAVASLRFTMQASGTRDELLRWLGPGCALAALARVNYLLFPSLYTGWLYTGDLLRTGFYAMLLQSRHMSPSPEAAGVGRLTHEPASDSRIFAGLPF